LRASDRVARGLRTSDRVARGLRTSDPVARGLRTSDPVARGLRAGGARVLDGAEAWGYFDDVSESRPRILLASASPRRRDLLRGAGLAFEIEPANIDETTLPEENVESLVTRLAGQKAEAVARRLPEREGDFVLGADTVVALDSGIIGKPEDDEHAVQILAALVGRVHRVLTGVAVLEIGGLRPLCRVVTSRVEMRDATPEEIRAYVATGESADKAGAYAIQGAGGLFVARVSGSETNVIGLPLDETLALLREAGAFGVRPEDPGDR
jgi:septum formation protein